MKKKFFSLMIGMLCIMGMGVFTACEKPDSANSSMEQTYSISLDKTEASLDLYETLTLTAATDSERVEWKAYPETVATVKDGVVTPLKEGTATITATVKGGSASCVVSVYKSDVMPVLAIDYETVSIPKTEQFTLTATALYKGKEIENAEFIWKLTGEEIVSLTVDKNTAVLEGITYGETEVEVSATVCGALLVKRIPVKVCNIDITYDVENLAPTEGGFAGKLATLQTGEHQTMLVPALTVYEKNTVIPSPDIVWESADGQIATVSQDGTVTAVSAGQVLIQGKYQDLVIRLFVEVYRPELQLADKTYFETVKNGLIVLPNAVVGEVRELLLGGTNVLQSYDEATHIAQFDKSVLPVAIAEMGETTCQIVTDKAIYATSAFVCTKAIRTVEDLDTMSTVAKEQNADAHYWDGYFVLAEDIAYNKVFETFVTNDTVSVPIHTTQGKGFVGVFDGDGHNIDGFITDTMVNGGLFGLLNGTVKNVSFTNAVHNGGYGFISACGAGKIENVYVHCKEASGESGFFFSHYTNVKTDAGSRVKNCFVKVDKVIGNKVRISSDWSNANGGVNTGVFAVGCTNLFRDMVNLKLLTTEDYTLSSEQKVGAYATFAELIGANADFGGFGNDFWKMCNGLPYPKNLTPPTLSERVIDSGAVGYGTTLTVKLNDYEMITVDDRATALGITVSGNRVMIPNDKTLFGKSFEITVSSVYDRENVVGTATYSIVESATVKVKETVSASLATYVLNNGTYTVGKANSFVIDLSAYLSEDITGTIVSAKVGDSNFATPTLVDGKKISLDTASLGESYGDRTVTVIIHDTDENENLSKVTTVTANIVVATLVINTANDLDAMGAVAYAQTADTKAWDGYFALGGNIAYNKTFATFTDYKTAGEPPIATVNETIGFIGTFDGRGYAIDGLATDYDTNQAQAGGVFGILNGTVKNVSFINATHNNAWGFVSAFGTGNIENVYVHCKSVTATGEGGIFFGRFVAPKNGYNVKNCFVKLENVACANVKITYDWANTNFKVCQNVFGIGTTNYCIQDGKLYTNETYANTSVSNVGAYATASDLLADVNSADSTINLNVFQATASSFWTIGTDGLPVPKTLV